MISSSDAFVLAILAERPRSREARAIARRRLKGRARQIANELMAGRRTFGHGVGRPR